MVFHEAPISSHRQPFESPCLLQPIVLNRDEEVGRVLTCQSYAVVVMWVVDFRDEILSIVKGRKARVESDWVPFTSGIYIGVGLGGRVGADFERPEKERAAT